MTRARPSGSEDQVENSRHDQQADDEDDDHDPDDNLHHGRTPRISGAETKRKRRAARPAALTLTASQLVPRIRSRKEFASSIARSISAINADVCRSMLRSSPRRLAIACALRLCFRESTLS